jgi:hypothetical protein
MLSKRRMPWFGHVTCMDETGSSSMAQCSFAEGTQAGEDQEGVSKYDRSGMHGIGPMND